MKNNKNFWNYVDMFIQTGIIFLIIIIVYLIAESLEKFIYRYTIFPFVAVMLIFCLGVLVGRGIERTGQNKPIGFFSKKAAEARRKKNVFIFSDDGATYVANKEIIDDLKSGEIVHIKQFVDEDFNMDDFDDIYKIDLNDIVDSNMTDDEDKKL